MRRCPANAKLLFGPYQAAALRVGDRAFCLCRDRDVVITSWSAGPISWPRCRALGTHGGGSGLLLDDVLAQAVRQESAFAVCWWWGVTEGVVWKWRRAGADVIGGWSCANCGRAQGGQRRIDGSAASAILSMPNPTRGTSPCPPPPTRRPPSATNASRF